MDGAQNVTIPNQTHVQTCTSAESFVAYYRFLTGHKPAHDIVRQSGSIRVAGKALNFPQNTGLQGATVQVWPVNANGASDHGGATRVDRDHRRLGGGRRLGAGDASRPASGTSSRSCGPGCRRSTSTTSRS